MAPVLDSISPSSGPPGTTVTYAGSGFDPGARVACPALVPTTWVSAAQLTAEIPAEFEAAAGQQVAIAVFVMNEDNSVSAIKTFTVVMPAAQLQNWTSIDAVTGEVPGFERGGIIGDRQIGVWMRSIAGQIAAAMLRRGLPLDPAQWQQPDTTGTPSPAEVLEMINRLGAAARLVAAVSAQFSSGDTALAKNLDSAYQRELKALEGGAYDKLFLPTAATQASTAQLAAGDMTDDYGNAETAFTKGKVF